MHEAIKEKFRAAHATRNAASFSRAVLLLHLQVALVALTALSFVVVLVYTEEDGRAFYLTLTSAALVCALVAVRVNFAGRYVLSLVITVAAMFVFPWISIVYERIVHSGDLIPAIYVIIPTQISALFLSGAIMVGLGFVQSGLFITLVLTDAARDNYNWPSLVCFVVFASMLGAITSKLISRRYEKAMRIQETLEENEKRLTEISARDALTGLYNRRHMEDVLTGLIDRKDPRFGVAMLDVDDYKAVNDKYGHACGDMLIREIADTIVAALAPGEIAFRYGGDEFLITLSGMNMEGAKARGEVLRRAVEDARYACLGAEDVEITASVGVSFFPDCGSDRDAVLRAADRALYLAKRTGKNRVVTCLMVRDAPAFGV